MFIRTHEHNINETNKAFGPYSKNHDKADSCSNVAPTDVDETLYDKNWALLYSIHSKMWLSDKRYRIPDAVMWHNEIENKDRLLSAYESSDSFQVSFEIVGMTDSIDNSE